MTTRLMLLALLVTCSTAWAYTVERVPNQGDGALVEEMVVYNNILYFSAVYGTNGRELGYYDAQANAAAGQGDMAWEFNATSHGQPLRFHVFDGLLYLNARDGASNPDLWVYDGSVATRINQIRPGNSGGNPNWLTTYNGELYFSASNGNQYTSPVGHGVELWTYDGSNASMVADIREYDPSETPGQTDSSEPKWLTTFNGKLYFQANKLNLPLPDTSTGIRMLCYDGSSVSTLPAIDTSGPDDSMPWNMTVFGDELFFIANDGVNGYEPWTWDGSSFNMIANINASGSSAPAEDDVHQAVVYNGAVYFSADNGSDGRELWRYDGTDVEMVADLEGTAGWSSGPMYLTVYRNALWFAAWTHPDGISLWRYDGQDLEMIDGTAGDGPGYLTVYDGTLYFRGEDETLWRVIPEPTSMALLGLGVCMIRRRRENDRNR